MRWIITGLAVALVGCGGGSGHDDTAVSAAPTPAPIATPTPDPTSASASETARTPAAGDEPGATVETVTLRCRATPPNPEPDPSAFDVTLVLDRSAVPWKSLGLVSPITLPFAVDPDGSRVQYDAATGVAYVPGPDDANHVAGSDQIKGAYYYFDANGLSRITERMYFAADFPVVCLRQ